MSINLTGDAVKESAKIVGTVLGIAGAIGGTIYGIDRYGKSVKAKTLAEIDIDKTVASKLDTEVTKTKELVDKTGGAIKQGEIVSQALIDQDWPRAFEANRKLVDQLYGLKIDLIDKSIREYDNSTQSYKDAYDSAFKLHKTLVDERRWNWLDIKYNQRIEAALKDRDAKKTVWENKKKSNNAEKKKLRKERKGLVTKREKWNTQQGALYKKFKDDYAIMRKSGLNHDTTVQRLKRGAKI